MTVRGGKAVAAALRRMPDVVRRNVADAIPSAASTILSTMKQLAPRDQGDLEAALTTAIDESGLAARVGLPTDELVRRFFYARFIENGTKGGVVTVERWIGAPGDRRKTKPYDMRVPARPATPFMKPAADLNRDEVEMILRKAVADALREARRK